MYYLIKIYFTNGKVVEQTCTPDEYLDTCGYWSYIEGVKDIESKMVYDD